MKKLCKSRADKKICGVCGGIARYLEIDSTVVRLVWIFMCCIFGFGVLAYFFAAFIMPYDDII